MNPQQSSTYTPRIALLVAVVGLAVLALAPVGARAAGGPDITAPVLTGSLQRTVLWPANLALLPVGLTGGANDDCDGALTVNVTVYSDEANGAAPFAPDAAGTTGIPSSFSLRAERLFSMAGGNKGRAYVISLQAMDSSGNASHLCITSVCPLLPSAMFIMGTQAEAMAGVALCNAGGGVIPPAMGWFPIFTFTLPPPIAAGPDAYDCIGNCRLTVPAVSGVLANDVTIDPPLSLTTAGSFLSANGGDVSLAPDGSFTYDPPVGFTGADTFTYGIMDSLLPVGRTATGTVTITVADMIWFIDNTAGAGGDGRQLSPFDSVLAFSTTAADSVGDTIFVDRGDGTSVDYNTGLGLLADQELYGEGVSLAANVSFTIPPFNTLPGAGMRPVLTNTAGSAITTAGGNTVRGLDISAPSAAGIFATGMDLTCSDVSVAGSGTDGMTFSSVSGTVDIDDVTVTTAAANGLNLVSCTASFDFDSACSVSNASGVDFRVSAGTCAVTYNGNLSQGGAGGLVSVVGGHSTGTVLFQSGSVGCTSGSGIRLGPCSSTTTFSAAMSLTTSTDAIVLSSSTGTTNFAQLTIASSGDGLRSSGGGTINATNASNSIVATSGSAIDIVTAIFNMTFSSVTSTSGTNGIRLGSCVGSFAVTGNTEINTPTSGALVVFGSGTLDVDFGTIDINGGASNGITITGGVGDFDVSGQTTIDGTTGTGIDISTSGGDTFTFADTDVGLTTACARGVSLTSSSGATFTFSDVDITSSAGAGLVCDTAGTLNITGSPAIDATGGAAIDITNTNGDVNGTGFTFASPVSTDSPDVGIRFDTTSEVILLTDVDIDSSSAMIDHGIEFTDCTGATKTVTRGHVVFTGTNDGNGIFVDNSDDVTVEGDSTSAFDPIGIPDVFTGAFEITGMGTGTSVQAATGGTGHHAIACIDSNGLTVDRCYIHDVGDTGNADALLDAGIFIDETTGGTVTISNNHIEDIIEADAVHIGSPASSFTGSSTFNITFNRVVGDPSNVGATTTEAGVQAAFKSTTGATIIGNFDDNEFEGSRLGINVLVDLGLLTGGGNSGTGAGGRNDFSASRNQVEDMDLLGISFDCGDDSVSRIIIDDNTIDASVNHTTFDTGPDQPIEVEIRNDDAEAPIVDAFVRDNTILKTMAAGPIFTGSGIKVETAGATCSVPGPSCAGRIRCMISGNNIGSIDDEGIEVQADENNTLEGIIRLNDVDHLTTVGSTLGGIDLDMQGSTDPATMRVWLDDNDSGADVLGYDIDEPAGAQTLDLAGETGHGLSSPITTNVDLVTLLNFNGNSSDNGGTSKVDASAGTHAVVTTASIMGPSLEAARRPKDADYVGRTLGDKEELASLVEEAKARWIAAGISRNDKRVLESISVEVARLDGGRLAKTWFTHITVDPDAAGFGWFVDETPKDDKEFSKTLTAKADSDAHACMDLLTVLMHEIGHVIGREHCTCGKHLMSHELEPGVRRNPIK